MMRLLGLIIRIALFVALAVWLADQPGSAHIAWHDYVIDTSAAALGLAALLLGLVFYLLFRIYHLLRYGPERWRLGRELRKLRQGQADLTAGFAAIAAGDAAEAGRLAVAARKQLGPATLTRLLQAQAAELAGDALASRSLYHALASESEGASLGYRGLIAAAQRQGDAAEAERFAAQLRRAAPDAPWLHLFDFESATQRGDWAEAQAALALLAPTRLLEPGRYRRYRAALLLTQAQSSMQRGDFDGAVAAAEQSLRQLPAWLPAILALAEAQQAAGHDRAALRLIEKHWAKAPHPQLAATCRAAAGDAMEAYRQVEKLARRGDDETANALALAEAAMAADLWGEARRHLSGLVNSGKTPAAACRLMAALERRESGNETAARQWLARAASAAADPAWVCEVCGTTHEIWQPVCRACGSFASQHWQEPRDAAMSGQPPRLLPSGLTGDA